jgi:hypothetical protein
MEQGAKPAKGKIEARPTVAAKSRKIRGAGSFRANWKAGLTVCKWPI